LSIWYVYHTPTQKESVFMIAKTIVETKQQAFPFLGLDVPIEKTNPYLKEMAEKGYKLDSEQLVLTSEGGIQTYHHKKIVDVIEGPVEKSEDLPTY